jgi:hypothetical protein
MELDLPSLSDGNAAGAAPVAGVTDTNIGAQSLGIARCLLPRHVNLICFGWYPKIQITDLTSRRSTE